MIPTTNLTYLIILVFCVNYFVFQIFRLMVAKKDVLFFIPFLILIFSYFLYIPFLVEDVFDVGLTPYFVSISLVLIFWRLSEEW